MSDKQALYTIRNWYKAKSGKGICLTASANINGKWSSVKIYVPYESRYEESATTRLPTPGTQGAIVVIPTEKVFNEEDL